jgi:hypothetical protein
MAFLPGLQKIISGEFWGGDERERAEQKLKEAGETWDSAKPKEIGPVDFENYNWQGDLEAPTVEAPDAIQYNNISSELNNLDPRLRDTQLAALASLQQISDKGGMQAQDVANLNRIQTDVAQADKGRREAIQQGMSRRGMGGSGMELLAALQSSQAATDRQSQAGLDVAGTAQQRALQALMQSGELAGNVRGQDVNIAQGKDAITQFNTTNGLRTSMYNTDKDYDARKTTAGMEFDARRANFGGKQDLANRRVDLGNKQQTINTIDIPQQNYDNTHRWAGGKTGQQTAASTYHAGRAKDASEAGKALGTGAAKGGKAAMDYYGAPDEEEQE